MWRMSLRHPWLLSLLLVCAFCGPARAVRAQVEPALPAAVDAAPESPASQLPAHAAPLSEGQHEAWLQPGALALGLSVLPSFVLHGSGAFAIGDRKTARKLVWAEVAGLGVFLAAGSLVAATGTSRRLIGILAPLTIAGFGVFMLSWLADLYAVSTGGRAARAASFSAPVEAELGYLYVHDPQFSFASLLTARGDLRAGPVRVSPAAWLAVDDDNQRFLLETAYRPWGRTPGRSALDGSYVDLVMGLRYARFATDGFDVITPEWRLDGRLDLARAGPSLAGSFVEGHVGAGLELYGFDAAGSEVQNNAFGLLLARFGFGVYFGAGGRQSGEALLYYDHRHDDFAAGLGVQGIGSGILGHMGLSGRYFVTREWGLVGLLEVGSAVVSGLSVRYRQAPRETGG